jgi:hypothetical protein
MTKTILNDPEWDDELRDAVLTIMEWAKKEDHLDIIESLLDIIRIMKEAHAVRDDNDDDDQA